MNVRTLISPRIALPAATLAAAAVALFAAGLGPAAAAPAGQSRARDYPLKVVFFHTAPGRPRANAPFIAGIGVINEETGSPVEAGDVSCRAKVGGRTIRVRAKEYSEGLAACAWMIARKTGGKRFSATISLNSTEGYVARKFTKVIRP